MSMSFSFNSFNSCEIAALTQHMVHNVEPEQNGKAHDGKGKDENGENGSGSSGKGKTGKGKGKDSKGCEPETSGSTSTSLPSQWQVQQS